MILNSQAHPTGVGVIAAVVVVVVIAALATSFTSNVSGFIYHHAPSVHAVLCTAATEGVTASVTGIDSEASLAHLAFCISTICLV